MKETTYFLVDSRVLPPVFQKVCEAKMLLAKKEAKNASDAARMVNISRSAFYKYKDFVHVYEDVVSDCITTISMNLVDKAGVLSSVIAKLYEIGAHILTINQNIPIDMVAPVTITVKTTNVMFDVDSISELLRKIDGVVSVKTYSNGAL